MTAAGASRLVIAAVIAGYVLMALSVLWARHHRTMHPPPPADVTAIAQLERERRALRERRR